MNHNIKFVLLTAPTTRTHETLQYENNYVYYRKGYGQMYYIIGLSRPSTYLASENSSIRSTQESKGLGKRTETGT